MSGTLYVVATPIGNLEDLTPRARQTLAAVAVIAAEDTRRTGRLLSAIGVKKPLFALHDHNEEAAVEHLIDVLNGGRDVALVSDAGTPLISDPGYRLVGAAHEHGLCVSPIPGASAVTAALAVSGLPTDRLCFEGFLPARSAARRAALETLANEARTIVLFESVHRIDETLEDLAELFGGDRPAFLGRELTKLHEQCVRGSLAELRGGRADGSIPAKGEFVLVIGGSEGARTDAAALDAVLEELIAVVPGKQAAAIAAKLTGVPRNVAYERMLALKNAVN